MRCGRHRLCTQKSVVNNRFSEKNGYICLVKANDSECRCALTLAEVQRTVDRWITTVGVRYFSPLTNTAILAEETGEVARVMARLYGDQSAKPGDSCELADELADVLWVVAALANQTGVDLTEAFERNLRKKTLRDSERHRRNPKLTDNNINTDSQYHDNER